MKPTPLPVFDGHNDVLLRLHMKRSAHAATDFLEGDGEGHLDLPRMQQGGMAAGFFAIFVPPKGDDDLSFASMNGAEGYDLKLPPPIDQPYALSQTLAMAGLLSRIEAASDGGVRICTTANDVRHCLKHQTLATIMHIEGAEAIDTDFLALDVLYRAGLRSVGLVWSRPTQFAHGVPFRFPALPDIGGGLTDAGRELVRALNQKRMMIDLSHLNEAGFWDVAAISDAPLVATHSNAHALCPHARNLTDRQLAAIRDTGGMVGLNFATAFLRPDGRMRSDTPIDLMVDQIDHLVEHLGIDGVGFGSDFDGAIVPADMRDVTGLPVLINALRARGYDDQALRKLCAENWISVLERTL